MVAKSTALTTRTFLRTILRIGVSFPTVESFVANKIVRKITFNPWETHNVVTSN